MKPVLLLACALPLAAQQGMNFYSIEKEIALGNSLAGEFQRNTTVTSDTRVERLGTALIPKGSFFQYHLRVFDGGGYEPVVFPGGWVFVPQPLLARDDRQLSAILAHAIAHIELRHGTRLATKRELAEIRTITANVAMPPGQSSDLVPMSMLKFQRQSELAADAKAVELLRAAGLDRDALVEYLRTLPPVEKPMFSDHPDPKVRIADLPQ